MPRTTVNDIAKAISKAAYRYHAWDIFRDFCEMGAIAISNTVDLHQREAREERYMQLIGHYDTETQQLFPRLLAMLTEALSDEPADVLGQVFMQLEIFDAWKGQFFTPDDMSRMMANVTLGEERGIREIIDRQGYVRVCEPASGGGSTVIALAWAMLGMDLNYQRVMHITAVDIDPTCVHMTYLQLSLLYIPAVVIQGNSLSLEERAHWFTPAHILDGWAYRLRRAQQGVTTHDPAPVPDDLPAMPELLPEIPVMPGGQLVLFA